MFISASSTEEMRTGEMRVIDLEGTRVTLARVNDQFYAFDDTCTHMGCSLASGDLDDATVTCACHGSQFDVRSGAVLRGPATQPVRARRVEVEGSALSVEV
jgi:nitrite reductase/ring-hydroxylating ferredoxin subunit